MFCETLSNAYVKEQERKERFAKLENDFKVLILTSKSPIRDTLKLYTTYNKYGFDEDLLTDSFSNLAVAFLLRGRVQVANIDIPVSYENQWILIFDFFKYEELYENWRFKDLVNDLKYALQQGVQLKRKKESCKE